MLKTAVEINSETYIAGKGISARIRTNGALLTPEKSEALLEAGLDFGEIGGLLPAALPEDPLHVLLGGDDHPGPAEPLKLSDAQLVIARGYGFTSWSALKNKIESLTKTPVEQFLSALHAGDVFRELDDGLENG